MLNGPHYLRFARALAFVSITLPVPTVVVAAQLTGCGGKTTNEPSGFSAAPEPDEPYGGGGIQVGPPVGSAPGPENPCSLGCGIQVAPDTGVVDATLDDGGDNVDGSDGGDQLDGGGPSRGTPELPASWLA